MARTVKLPLPPAARVLLLGWVWTVGSGGGISVSWAPLEVTVSGLAVSVPRTTTRYWVPLRARGAAVMARAAEVTLL